MSEAAGPRGPASRIRAVCAECGGFGFERLSLSRGCILFFLVGAFRLISGR